MVSTRQSSNMASPGGIVSVGSSVCEAGPSRSRGLPQTGSRNFVPPQSPLQTQRYLVGTGKEVYLSQLPIICLEKICGYLDYNTIAQMRMVSREMNRVCSAMLNSGFSKMQNQMLNKFQLIKAQMPRRESARRTHPRACESDIIETLHMRLTLLQMSFGKHIERKHCCFFPGAILDEVNRILDYIKVTPNLARPYKVTDELFDLSTMAMEYFKDKLEPSLPEIPYFGADFLDLAGGSFSPSSSSTRSLSSRRSRSGTDDCSPSNCSVDRSELSPLDPDVVIRRRLRRLRQTLKKYTAVQTSMRKEMRTCKSKISEQQKQLLEFANRFDDVDKKNEETTRKFSTLLQELNKCKTELQYWRSKSPAIPVCGGCGQSMIVPTDDLQTLANQAVLSVPLPDPFRDSLDFIPIEMAAQQPDSALPEIMAPPTSPLPSVSPKRKATTSAEHNDDTKKCRRTGKTRQAKRSKM